MNLYDFFKGYKNNNDTSAYQSGHWRNDIEGLRFFAITPIVLFHYRPDLMPNGYLGVDLFFIISGYLTSIQFHYHQYNTPRAIIFFIKKRIARILPALGFWAAFFSLIFGFYLIPQLHQSYFYTALFSLLGASNLYLYSQGLNYFSPSQNLNPFLHLWSISVEDQFYLSFALLGLISSILSLKLKHVIQAAFIISLFFFWLEPSSFDSVSYFLPQFRFWEFMLGAAIYFVGNKTIKLKMIDSNKIKFTCFVLLLVILLFPYRLNPISIFIFSILSASVLVPDQTETITSKFLSLSIFRYIGRISYSTYLVHFPIIKLFEYYYDLNTSIWTFLFFLISLGTTSSFSYNFIEKPIFLDKNLTYHSLFNILIKGLLIIEVSTVIPSFLPRSITISHELSKAEAIKNDFLKNSETSGKILVLGDSPAQMFGKLFNVISSEENLSFLDSTGTACIFGYNIEYTQSKKTINSCKSHMNNIIDNLKNTQYLAIFVANRLSAYFSPRLISIDDTTVSNVKIDTESFDVANYTALDAYLKHINYIITNLPKQNFIILDPIPEMKVPTFKCLINNTKEECHTNRESQKKYIEATHAGLSNIAKKHANVKLLELFDTICKNNYCSNIHNGEIIYRDDDHLSNSFVAKHKELFMKLIRKNP